MHHVFYLDGNAKKISWVIDTKGEKTEQQRDHAELYFNKVSDLQSKYIALHVGLFWGIGTFIIKNNDSLEIILDEKIMFEHLANQTKVSDEFIAKRTKFLKQLIIQRKLDVTYKLNTEENFAKLKV